MIFWILLGAGVCIAFSLPALLTGALLRKLLAPPKNDDR